MTRAPGTGAASRGAPIITSDWLAYLLITLTILFFAGNTVLGRAVRADIPPMALVFWRNLAAVLVLLPLLYPRIARQRHLLRRHWRLLAVLGTAQALIGNGALYLGLHTTTAMNAGLLHTTQPALTFLFAWLLLGDRMSLRQLGGLMIALIGVCTIVARGSLASLLGLEVTAGDFFVLLAFVAWAFYTALAKRLPRDLDPFVAFTGLASAAVIGVLPFYVAEAVWLGHRLTLDLAIVGSVLYTAMFASILGLVFINLSVARIGPGRAGCFSISCRYSPRCSPLGCSASPCSPTTSPASCWWAAACFSPHVEAAGKKKGALCEQHPFALLQDLNRSGGDGQVRRRPLLSAQRRVCTRRGNPQAALRYPGGSQAARIRQVRRV